jgi:hypothetical protein
MDLNDSQDTWQAESVSSSSETLETLPEPPDAWEPGGESEYQAESRLTLAKATRDQAETIRQKVAEEILEATRKKCQELLINGNNALQNAKRLEAEADMWHLEAQDELTRAESIRAQAEADRKIIRQNAKSIEMEAETRHSEAMTALERAKSIEAQSEAGRERILADAHRVATDVIHTARMEAEREHMESERVCLDLKRQASMEAQGILAEARAIREELEAQRIYADAARLRAWSHEILMQVDEQPDQARVLPRPSTNGNTVFIESEDLAQATSVEPVSSETPPQPEQSAAPNNGKKSTRATQAADPTQATSVEPDYAEAPSEPA